MKMNMKQLNNPLRNTLETIRNTYEDALYRSHLQRFFKGTYAFDELNHKVGVLERMTIRIAIYTKLIKDMPLACHLRRFRINRKNNII